MSHNSSHSVARWLCLILAGGLTACGGGSARGQASTSSTTPTTEPAPAAPTTRPVPAIDLSQPIPGGSLHGTPRPPLENTGDDYVAITKSLIANLRWISENPDPGLIADVFVPGTPGHDNRVSAYEFLVSNGYRWADEGFHVLSVDVVDVRDEIASVHLVQQLSFERLFDDSGAQVGDVRAHSGPETLDVLLSKGPDGRWRIAGGGLLDTEVDV
jgi:hypothetical protein